ncbi:hypothetical protein F4604DRAFT_1899647 [Suillus subluteus]|nr:hypothetical protein F4604DRAFT_1899647 [Suillus subluteus]
MSPPIAIATKTSLGLKIVLIWTYLLISINYIFKELFPIQTWIEVIIPASMAATWLLAIVLVRIPITRRSCIKDARGLSILCWVFCGLWLAQRYYDNLAVETWSPADILKQIAIVLGSTLALALEFMVTLCFWGNLKWKHPIMTVWYLVSGTLEQAFHDLVPSENNLDLFAYTSLPHEDADLSDLSDSELDEKPYKLEV